MPPVRSDGRAMAGSAVVSAASARSASRHLFGHVAFEVPVVEVALAHILSQKKG